MTESGQGRRDRAALKEIVTMEADEDLNFSFFGLVEGDDEWITKGKGDEAGD